MIPGDLTLQKGEFDHEEGEHMFQLFRLYSLYEQFNLTSGGFYYPTGQNNDPGNVGNSVFLVLLMYVMSERC